MAKDTNTKKTPSKVRQTRINESKQNGTGPKGVPNK